MQNLNISSDTRAKLAEKHSVTVEEIEQCFMNRQKGLLKDKRAQHATNPPTLWFVAETNKGRVLKVVYIQNGLIVDLKTCYPANAAEISIYQTHA